MRKSRGPGNASKPETSTTPDEGTPSRGKGLHRSPTNKPKEGPGSRGPGLHRKPKSELPDLPAGTRRVAPEGKGAHPEPRAKQTSPVSKSGTNINPDLQRRHNKLQSKKGSSRQNLATTRERMIKKGDLKRTGEGGDISASRAYKQIGLVLAEMFNLIENRN